MSDDEPKIKVFASDDNLKALGELLSNDSSRSIIYNLMTREMYTNEIATKLDMRVSLVIHHLKKLEDLGLLEITEKKIKRKGQEHRFFQIKSNIFVVIDNTKKDIEEKGILKRIFNDGVKFGAIAIAGFITWSSNIMNYSSSKEVYPVPFGQNIPIDPLIPALTLIIISLIIERIYIEIKKKKKRVST